MSIISYSQHLIVLILAFLQYMINMTQGEYSSQEKIKTHLVLIEDLFLCWPRPFMHKTHLQSTLSVYTTAAIIRPE